MNFPDDGPESDFSAADGAQRTTNENGSVTYRLSVPTSSEGEVIEEVTLRRCKPSDLMAADNVKGGNTSRNIFLIARLANIPEATVRKLDGFDYMELNEIAADFLRKPPETGGKLSSPSDGSRTSPGQN